MQRLLDGNSGFDFVDDVPLIVKSETRVEQPVVVFTSEDAASKAAASSAAVMMDATAQAEPSGAS